MEKKKETTWQCSSCQDLAETSTTDDTDPTANNLRRSNNRLSIGPGAVLLEQSSDSKANTSEKQQKKEVSLNDIMEKLTKMESQYSVLLEKYDKQIKINADLKAEIDTIKEQLQNDNNANKSFTKIPNSDLVNESVREMSERQFRQRNLIIFGASEATPTDGFTKNEEDINMAKDIISKSSPGTNTQGIRVFRIGREGPSKKRPIKVILESANEVKNIIRNAKELKKIDKYTNISLSFDRTPKQIAEYNTMKETLTTRLRNGETNIKIRYVNGFPKIVKINEHLN